MASSTFTTLSLLFILLLLLPHDAHAFKHKNYCGTICKLGQCAKVKVHVHENDKVHITLNGILEVDKDFRIYKREGSRIFIRICSETGLLCKEEYELHDHGDKISVFIKMPVYMLGDVREDLLPCQMNLGDM